MYSTYVESGCAREGRILWHIFQDITVPYTKTIHITINKL
jgi:hypothetical protein